MKVTAIEPSGNLYGSEYCLLDIIEGTSSHIRWDVVLPSGGGFDDLLTRKGIRNRPLLARDSHRQSMARKATSYLKLRQHLRHVHPDLIYLNQAGMLKAVSAIAQSLDLKIVCQIQTLEDAEHVKVLPAQQRHVSAFICNSSFIAKAAAVPPEKQCIFYQPKFGLLPRERAAPRYRNGRQWRVAILGRIAETKGHHVFLDAARILLAAGRQDVQFVVIGEGISPEISADFAERVDRSGLRGCFDLRGYRPDPHEQLAQVDVLAVPSIAEPLGRVLLDAAASGRPAIVSNSGGLGEFSREFDLGRRIPPSNPAELAKAIEVVLDCYENERRTFLAAADAMFKRLDPDSYLASITTVLQNSAADRPSAIEWRGRPN